MPGKMNHSNALKFLDYSPIMPSHRSVFKNKNDHNALKMCALSWFAYRSAERGFPVNMMIANLFLSEQKNVIGRLNSTLHK